MRNRQRVLGVLIFCWLTAFSLYPTFAQESIPDFEDGPFEQAAENMDGLLRFGVVNKRLRIERGWDLALDRQRADEGPQDELEAAIERRVRQGFDQEKAENLAKKDLARGSIQNRLRNNALNHAFGIYLQTFGSKSGGFSGGNGNFRSYHSGQDFAASVQDSEGDLSFEFAELDFAGRRFSVFESVDARLNLNFTADDLLVDLRQQSDGRVRLAIVGEESANLYVASNFATLVSEHPKPVNNIFYPLLKKLGIQKPVSDSDSRVRNAVIKRLVATANDDMQVGALVDQIEADSFSSRDEATNELRQNYFIWQDLIKKNTAEKPNSEEINQRLKKITEGWPANEIHDFIQNNELVDSPAFLIDLLETANPSDKSVIVERLVDVTGEDFGEDVEEWQAWLKSTGKQ